MRIISYGNLFQEQQKQTTFFWSFDAFDLADIPLQRGSGMWGCHGFRQYAADEVVIRVIGLTDSSGPSATYNR